MRTAVPLGSGTSSGPFPALRQLGRHGKRLLPENRGHNRFEFIALQPTAEQDSLCGNAVEDRATLASDPSAAAGPYGKAGFPSGIAAFSVCRRPKAANSGVWGRSPDFRQVDGEPLFRSDRADRRVCRKPAHPTGRASPRPLVVSSAAERRLMVAQGGSRVPSGRAGKPWVWAAGTQGLSPLSPTRRKEQGSASGRTERDRLPRTCPVTKKGTVPSLATVRARPRARRHVRPRTAQPKRRRGRSSRRSVP